MKLYRLIILLNPIQSLPLRGAWIEISSGQMEDETACVAPLAGGVD